MKEEFQKILDMGKVMFGKEMNSRFPGIPVSRFFEWKVFSKMQDELDNL